MGMRPSGDPKKWPRGHWGPILWGRRWPWGSPNAPPQRVVPGAGRAYQSVNELLLPGGRLREQRDVAYEGLSAIDGVSVVKASGALYMFPRIDREMYRLEDDEQFAYDLLRSKKLLVNHGTGFNYPEPDHLRLVTLPQADVPADAVDRTADHLAPIRR